jgi:fluoride ion exporter CrcB/FEX
MAVILVGALFGALLRKILPDHHLPDGTKDYVRLGTGLIATISALVLGLLIASANSSYDTESSQVRHLTANIVLLDSLLDQYGPGNTRCP